MTERYIYAGEISEADFAAMDSEEQTFHKLKGTAVVTKRQEEFRSWKAKNISDLAAMRGLGKTQAIATKIASMKAEAEKYLAEQAAKSIIQITQANKPAYRNTLGKKGNKWA
jgi:hypothetical protein